MKEHLLPAMRLTLALALIFAVAYPIAIWGIAQLSPGKGGGVLLEHAGRTHFLHVGQRFDEDRYFQGRPSAVGYDAALSGASNKGPNDPDYLSEMQARVDSFLSHNPGASAAKIPAEFLTASGSGLDPHISVPAALVQVKRIARARHLAERDLELLVGQCTEAPLFGFLGPEKIHLLRLNIALDQLSATFEGQNIPEK